MNPKAKSVRSDGFARWRRRFDAIVRADIGCGRKNFDAGSRRIMFDANNADSADAVNSAQRHVLKSTKPKRHEPSDQPTDRRAGDVPSHRCTEVLPIDLLGQIGHRHRRDTGQSQSLCCASDQQNLDRRTQR